MKRRNWTREQQRRYKEAKALYLRDIVARLRGGYTYKCRDCGKDFKSNHPDEKYPCCPDCPQF